MIPSAQRADDPQRFPAAVRFLAEAGAAAPSADNSQPWRFGWDRTFAVYYRQPEAGEPLFPIEHPATRLALGAVIENLAQAASAIGLPFDPTPIQAGASGQPLLRLAVAADVAVVPDTHALPLFGRQTNRFPFARTELPAALLAWASAQREGAARCLVWQDRKPIRALSRLVRQASEARFQTQEIHEWLGRSLRFTAEEVGRGDGLDVATLHLPPGGRQMLRLTRDWSRMRLFNRLGAYKGFARVEAAAVAKAPALLTIVAPDAASDIVGAGRLLERIWIELNRMKIAVHPYFVITDQLYRLQRGTVPAGLTPLIERTQAALDAMLGGHDQPMLMLLRVGWPGVNPPRAKRLPVAALLSHGA